MNEWTFTIGITASFIVAKILGPLWAKYVGWHLRVSQHRWVMPALVFPFGIAAVLYFKNYQSAGMMAGFLGAIVFFFFLETVGAECPECRKRLRSKSLKDGPLVYKCDSCGFRWSSWGSKRLPE